MGNMNTPAKLDAELKVRLEQSTKTELERIASAKGSNASQVARVYITEGVLRERLYNMTTDELRELRENERSEGRAFGPVAEACLLEIMKRGEKP